MARDARPCPGLERVLDVARQPRAGLDREVAGRAAEPSRPRQVALRDRDGRHVVEGQGQSRRIPGGMEVADGVRDVLPRLVDVAVAQQRRPEHVQRPCLHRQVADLAEDRQRLAELLLAVPGEFPEVAVVAEAPQRIAFTAPVA